MDACNYFFIPTCNWIYSFIYYLIVYVISFYQLNYCFLTSEICKGAEEKLIAEEIADQTSKNQGEY